MFYYDNYYVTLWSLLILTVAYTLAQYLEDCSLGIDDCGMKLTCCLYVDTCMFVRFNN